MKLSMRILVASSVGLALAVGVPSSANAATVGTTPASWTPYLLTDPHDQVVEELEPCNGVMYAVGTIAAVGRGTSTYSRFNAFSFSETTGAMTSWTPHANGSVRSIAFSPDCSVAYLGGSFTTMDGVSAPHLAAVNTSTGALISTFKHSANNEVKTVRYVKGQVIIGGRFTKVNGVARTRIASLDPTTGTVTNYLNLDVSGSFTNNGTMVFNSQISHGGDKLMIEGVFTSVAGQPRQQIAILQLGSGSVTLDPWVSPELSQGCVTHFYARSAAWSPDDSRIYTATTGYLPLSGPGSSRSDPRAQLCDAVVAFPYAAGTVHHIWINYSGCDSYHSVIADASNVYVSGHERWANNPNGCDFAGPGAVSRPGIADIDATSGLATPWNPTRSLGHGSHQLLLTGAGLWVASDTWKDGLAQKCGGQKNHGGICFFPF